MDLQFPRLDGSRVGFHTDNRWWQWSLGVHELKELPELLEKFGLQQELPQYFLIRPDEILAAKHIPADKVRDVVTEHLKPVPRERPKGADKAPPK